MKTLLAVVCLLLALPLSALAESKSVQQKVFGPDVLENEDTIYLNRNLQDPLKLYSRFANAGKPEANLASPLADNSKKSIVIINNVSELNEFEPELKKAVLSAAGGKAKFANYLVFANFVHERPGAKKSEFFIAMIDKKSVVEKVSLQMQWFGDGLGGHAQIRFVLDRPFLAIPQMSDQYQVQTVEYGGKGDMIYSLQAIPTEATNAEWNPLLGILGEYAYALQFFSTPAKARIQITSSVVKEYLIMNLTAQEKQTLFNNAIMSSNSKQETGIYNTVLNSCITAVLNVLSSLRTDNQGTHLGKVNTMWFNPYSLFRKISATHPGGLQLSGSLNDQFAYLVDGKVLAMNDIRQTDGYKVLNKFRRSIIETDEFDKIVIAMAAFIADKRFTYEELNTFFQEAAKRNPKLTPKAMELVQFSKSLWEKSFRFESYENFLKMWQGVRSQSL